MTKRPRHPERPAGRGPGAGACTARLALLAIATLGALAAKPLTLRPPRDPARVTQITQAGPHSGDCDQCHTTHGDEQAFVYPNALVGPDDNLLCSNCHNAPWSGGSWATDPLYRATGHGANTSMIWPGPDPPPRIEPDAATKCLNCHDPHGWTDAQGTVPHLSLAREEKLCLTCHDGSPAASNISIELMKPYRHPVTDISGRHSGPTESQPSDFGTSPLNQRHSECEDCHNPHVSRADGPSGVNGNDASKLVLGVSRVSVLNGAAGSPPVYTFIPGSDTLSAPSAEYQLCFKCHSGWTTQPGGQTDLGLVLNPANPSYHPVEGPGRNAFIAPGSFVPPWGAGSITRCGDCHGSDFGTTSGPHGSTYQYILRAPSPASPMNRTMSSNELCFRCHDYDTYANPAAPGAKLSQSRWNPPEAATGHAQHVGTDSVPCYACHVTHGSTSLPSLMVNGRVPGMIAFSATPGGGTCTSTCHAVQSYVLNYAR